MRGTGFPIGLDQSIGSLRPRIMTEEDRKSTRLNSSHLVISYAVFCLKKKKWQEPMFLLRRGAQSNSGLSNLTESFVRPTRRRTHLMIRTPRFTLFVQALLSFHTSLRL